jgi:hypothetical protein
MAAVRATHEQQQHATGYRVYLVVLVAGHAMKIFDAGEGQGGEFEQGFAVSCERQRLPRMPVCISENNTMSQIVESAGGRTHARVAGTEVDVENGGSDSKSERRGYRRLGVYSRCCTSGSRRLFTLHDIASRSHAMLAARATTAKAIRDT